MHTQPDIPHLRLSIGERQARAVEAALRAGRLAQGEGVRQLEAAVAQRCGSGVEVVAVASGTAGLYLALAALDLDPGGEVLVPSYTCNSLYAAACHAGLRPRCADCPPDGVSLDAAGACAALTPAARAIIVPHTLGFLADCAAIARETGVPLLEDATHTFGRPPEDAGNVWPSPGACVAVVSLYATKLLPAGEGGLCITRHAGLAGRLRALRECDERPPEPQAFNFKMSDLHAALALAALPGMDDDVRRRAELADRFDAAAPGLSWRRQTSQPQPVCFRYLVRAPQGADGFIAEAAARGLQCRRPVYRPLHLVTGDACPRAAARHADLVSVPLYAGLTEAEVAAVTRSLAALTPC